MLFNQSFSNLSVVLFSVIGVSVSLFCYIFCRGSSHIPKLFLVVRSFGSNFKPLLLGCHCFCSHCSTFLMVNEHSHFFSLLSGQRTCKFIAVAKIILTVPENVYLPEISSEHTLYHQMDLMLIKMKYDLCLTIGISWY